MELAQFLKNDILRKVGILILVDHDIPESAGYRLQRSRIITQKDVHIQKDIIKIHYSSLSACFSILLIDLPDERFLGRNIILHRDSIPHVRFRRDQIILGHRNTGKHIFRLIYLIIKLKAFQA